MNQQLSIRDERIARGLSVASAADAIGISRRMLARAEHGRVPAKPSSAVRIASFYGIRVDWAEDLAQVAEWESTVDGWIRDADAVTV